jgi:hypothetical protein
MAEKEGMDMAPPGAWTARGYTDEENDRIDQFREKFFAQIMTHTPGFGIWRKDFDGTRLRHELFNERYAGKPPLDLFIYFDPSFVSLYVQAQEFPLRRGLRRACGIPVKVFLSARNGVKRCRVSASRAGCGETLIRVSKRLEDPSCMPFNRLMHSTFEAIETVGNEATLLRECLG